MTNSTQVHLLKILANYRQKLKEIKPLQYQAKDNPLSAFEEIGNDTNLDPIIVALVLRGKHKVSIDKLTKQILNNELVDQDIVTEKFADFLAYTEILYTMLIERNINISANKIGPITLSCNVRVKYISTLRQKINCISPNT